MYDLSYEKRLSVLKLYSLQRRRDRYQIIYIWKILEKLVSNLEPPITTTHSDRLGRMCYKQTVPPGHQGSLVYNRFRWKAVRLFNSLPISIRNITKVNVSIFKAQLDIFLSTIRDAPCVSFEDNSINSRINEHSYNMLWRASTAGLAV